MGFTLAKAIILTVLPPLADIWARPPVQTTSAYFGTCAWFNCARR